MPPLLALGRNPFMLVMLAQVYAAGGGTLPANRGKLFAAFVDTLLGREERRCEPARWPGTDLIRRCLSHLAFAMQRAGKHGTAVDSNWAAQKVGRGVSDPLHLLYLGVSATLLDRAGDRIRFVHQLVQEYFAALDWDEHITMDEDLRAYWPSGWLEPSGWEETALLLTGILPDMTSMIEKLLLVNPPLAARCVVQSGGTRPAKPVLHKVQQRLIDLAIGSDIPVRERDASGEALNWLGDPRPGVGLTPEGLPSIVWCDVPEGEFVMGGEHDVLSSRQMKKRLSAVSGWMRSESASIRLLMPSFRRLCMTGATPSSGSIAGRRWDGTQRVTASNRTIMTTESPCPIIR